MSEPPPAASWLRQYCEQSVEFLRAVYDDESGLFPYSTSVVDGRYVNDFHHPQTIRYTINTLLGLSEAAKAPSADSWLGTANAMVDTFMSRRYDDVKERMDLGLLLVLLSASGDDARAELLARRLAALVPETDAKQVNMQEAAWVLWGLTAWSRRTGDPGAVTSVFRRMAEMLVDERTGLPRHNPRRYRRNLVSFGSISYFLRSVYEYGKVTGDETAIRLFERGVRRVLGLQGPQGEWPWLMNARTGAVIDPYPIFSVHQDSMSMLFLLPAADEGLPGVHEAIRRSCAWVVGENELGRTMFEDEPFRAFRSIERPGGNPRARRYLRAFVPGLRGADFGAGRVRINPECRSYHLGWLLYVWSRRVGALQEQAPSSMARSSASRTSVAAQARPQ